ncbi:MAG: Hint domain-containing protein [Pseudomonadota bacterium]
MPTTFVVVSLGVQTVIDPTEENLIAEDASALVGLTFGGVGSPLLDDFVTFSPGSTGFNSQTADVYDTDNDDGTDTFRIDGGSDQLFDAAASYNATITYVDGTTATITAVIFQDTAGNTYWAPEFTPNTDQAAIEAGAIRSLTLDSLDSNNFLGMEAIREDWVFVTCFTPGAKIQTPTGARLVEDLSVGDRVTTRDAGAQPIRWIGQATRPARGRMAPIRISAGALGPGIPSVDLIVSPQHRMLLRSNVVARLTGCREALVPAKKLLSLPGVAEVEDWVEVTYIHLLLDAHQIIYADGAPTESLFLGPEAQRGVGPEARAEIAALYPDLVAAPGAPARPIPNGQTIRKIVAHHTRNAKPACALG